jgi:tetratricopeptide (TPR) repeat protein
MTTPSPFERALELLRSGSPVEAEKAVSDAVKEAAERHGAVSQEHAAALFDHARLLLAMGALPRAAALLRSAAGIPATTPEARRSRATYLMNLGEVLQRLGELDQAHKALEESVELRRDLYGAESEGLAFGELPLADVLFWQGQLERAEELIEESAGVLWYAHNANVVAGLALRAAIRAAKYGDERPLLEHLDALPPELKRDLINVCLLRSESDPPVPTVLVLQELRERLEDEEALRPLLPQVVSAKARAARRAGDAKAREEALTWLVKHFDEVRDREQALAAQLGLAFAQDEAGQTSSAEKTYAEAARRADALGNPAARASAYRNGGLFFSKHGRNAEADTFLAESLASAEKTSDPMLIGPALVARGVFLQHTSRSEEAKAVLERAIGLLPAAHPDVLFARSHLAAIGTDRPCGCGDTSGALSKALEELLKGELPEGLLTAIRFDASSSNQLQVQLSRAPTVEEKEKLDRALRQAVSKLEEQLRARAQL